jgi:hypothetical protein
MRYRLARAQSSAPCTLPQGGPQVLGAIDPQSLTNRSGVRRDLSLPFSPTRAGASQTVYPQVADSVSRYVAGSGQK